MKKLLLVLVFCFACIQAQNSICIDAGHGGTDPGALGWDLQEKNINLDVAKRLSSLLQQNGWKTYLVRSGDQTVSLSGRTSYANSLKVSRFVSIHCNAFNKSANGTETFAYTSGSSTSFNMRNKVHPEIVRAMGTRDRGTKTANFYVIKYTNMPAILCELAFIDYQSDAAKLGDSYYRQKCAEAIRRGIGYSLTRDGEQQIHPQTDYVAPRWSPDGKTLMVTNPGYHGIYTVSAEGGEAQLLNSENHAAYSARWVSSDTIEYQSQEETFIVDRNGNKTLSISANRDFSIEDGSIKTSGKTIKLKNDEIYRVVVSPDGQKIAFEALKSGVHVANIDGTQQHHIAQGNNVVWSTDSQSVIFDCTKDNGHEILEGNICLVNIAQRSGTVNLTENISLVAQRPSISPDGQKIAFDANGKIFVGDIVDGKIQEVQELTITQSK